MTATEVEMLKHCIDTVGVYAPKLWDYLKKVHNKKFIDAQKLLANYYYKELERIKNINTIYKSHTPMLFDEVYIPLSIESHSDSSLVKMTKKNDYDNEHEYEISSKNIKENETIVIDEFPYETLSNMKRILIIDTAGMGKSTIIKNYLKKH